MNSHLSHSSHPDHNRANLRRTSTALLSTMLALGIGVSASACAPASQTLDSLRDTADSLGRHGAGYARENLGEDDRDRPLATRSHLLTVTGSIDLGEQLPKHATIRSLESTEDGRLLLLAGPGSQTTVEDLLRTLGTQARENRDGPPSAAKSEEAAEAFLGSPAMQLQIATLTPDAENPGYRVIHTQPLSISDLARAVTYPQALIGYSLTQLVGRHQGQAPVRTPDTWVSLGGLQVGGLNLEQAPGSADGADNTDSQASPATLPSIPVQDEAVLGICSLPSTREVQLRDGESATHLHTRTIVTSTGSPLLVMRDPGLLSPLGVSPVTAVVDEEQITTHDLREISRRILSEKPELASTSTPDNTGDSDNTADSENAADTVDTGAVPTPPTAPGLGDLGLSPVVEAAPVAGLAELDCLSPEQAQAWSGHPSRVGSGNPAVLAVLNTQLADTYTVTMAEDLPELLANGAAETGETGETDQGPADTTDSTDPTVTAQARLAQLPETTAAVLINPEKSVVTDLFEIASPDTEGDLALPGTPLTALAVDTLNPHVLWASFEDSPRLYRLELTGKR